MRRYREMDTDNLPEGLAHDFAVLGRAIAVMPDVLPPADFLAGVMGQLQPKSAPWWRRALIRFSAPSLNLSPLQLVPAGVAAAAVLLACLFWGYGTEPAGTVAGVAVKPGLAKVAFTLNLPQARNVALVGNFNDWSPAGFEMSRDERSGQWTITVPLDSGRHEYAFLVDYERMVPDPGAVIRHADGFGNVNSVLVVDAKHARTT